MDQQNLPMLEMPKPTTYRLDPDGDNPVKVEDATPIPQDLRGYQAESVDAIMREHQDVDATLLVLPTGTGKTTVFSDWIRRTMERGDRTLVIAHRNELIDQARARIYQQTGTRPGKEKASDFANRDDQIVVGSIQSMRGSRLEAWPPDHFQNIVVDEAHHIKAQTYEDLLEWFTGYKLLGVTATPDRADGRELGDHFDSVAYQYSLIQAIDDKYLVPIKAKRISDYKIDLRGVGRSFGKHGDFKASDLDRQITKYVRSIADTIRTECEGRRTLVFLPKKATVARMVEELQDIGVKAEGLTDDNTEETRTATMARFKDGTVDVLCNVMLFTEGLDVPQIDCVVVARPTMSRALYAQMIGRGTRPWPGKDHLLIVDFTWNYKRHEIATTYDLFAAEGFEQRVRDIAEEQAGDEPQDVIDAMRSAHDAHYDFDSTVEELEAQRLATEAYDPFTLARLANMDLDGEMSFTYRGTQLQGEMTRAQFGRLVYRHGADKNVVSDWFNDPRGKEKAARIMTAIDKNGGSIGAMISRAKEGIELTEKGTTDNGPQVTNGPISQEPAQQQPRPQRATFADFAATITRDEINTVHGFLKSFVFGNGIMGRNEEAGAAFARRNRELTNREGLFALNILLEAENRTRLPDHAANALKVLRDSLDERVNGAIL